MTNIMKFNNQSSNLRNRKDENFGLNYKKLAS